MNVAGTVLTVYVAIEIVAKGSVILNVRAVSSLQAYYFENVPIFRVHTTPTLQVYEVRTLVALTVL